MLCASSIDDLTEQDGRRALLRHVEDAATIALQPIVDIHSGELVACEALVSDVGNLGYSSVQALLDHAAALDALLELEAVLIDKAVSAFAAVRATNWALLFLNIDARNAEQPEALIAILVRTLRQRGLQPCDVCIEISERNAGFRADVIEASVAAFKAAGFSVAIDDYGTGSSGMILLHRCCPNFLKIDRFFTASIQSDRRKKVMVASIVNLSHALGIRVIAEGIETLDDLHQCRDVRCDLAQGWLIEPPVARVGGVADEYPVVARNPDRRVPEGPNLRLLSRMLQPVTLRHDATIEEVIDVFRSNPRQTAIPILDCSGMPAGVIHERDIKPFVFSQFGRDLARNRAFAHHGAAFIRQLPIADAEMPIGPLLDIIGTEEVDGILLTTGARYVGYLPFSAVAALANELRIEAMADRNPLTRLPANGAVKAFIDAAVIRSECPRVLCYVDLDDFKPFNDIYGFRAGDRALMMLSDRLKGIQIASQAFVGHIGGDDFFVGATDREVGTLLPHLVRAQQEFRIAAESLYSPQDRMAGYVTGKARDGRIDRFDLLSCTIAVLELPAGCNATGGEQATNLLAQVKLEAKKFKGSLRVRHFDDFAAEHRIVGTAA